MISESSRFHEEFSSAVFLWYIHPMEEKILLEHARQNNLKGFSVELPLHRLIVITGVSGSGKSSLAFDTIYAEGQRRYFETFSAYTRQFLDRMDKPRVDRVEGIPPAIAIDQTNPVRTSRSTVGTMTELNDHLKLLFSKAARLYCRSCGREVARDTPDSVFDSLTGVHRVPERKKLIITFTITVPHNFEVREIKGILSQQGYHNFFREDRNSLEVIQDRLVFSRKKRSRIVDALEQAFRHGGGKLTVHLVDDEGGLQRSLRFSRDLHCADCDIHYQDPVPNMFSFNSPIGACETCRGFGRTIGIDYDLVVPDGNLSIAEGAIKPFQSKSYEICQQELMEYAESRSIRTDTPWKDLSPEEKEWVIRGEGDWDEGVWYGTERFFKWLESKSYKMHLRVLLSKYRIYHSCPACHGARLKPESLLWRLGGEKDSERFLPEGPNPPGLNIHELMQLPLEETARFFSSLDLPSPVDEAVRVVLGEIRSRLHYLLEVGVGYLTLDRQSRTLSGGEVQRINLTTALGTSLVNTLFVLDEPSIGLHSRDIRRLISILKKLRDSGNTLLVVEHDPQIIMAADLVIDMGPAAGEKGGEIRFIGTPRELLERGQTLTADYLTGRKRVPLPSASAASLATYDPEGSTGPAGSSTSAGRDFTGRVSADGRDGRCVTVLGAAEHNLKSIDVDFPLHRLVCVAGVSGSGKSTLIQDILYHGLRKIKHRTADQPGAHRELIGTDLIDDVILVDQSPIGKTARSNPVSYVGALDPIRKIFAGEALAISRGYTAGTFSFNNPEGRCPVCGGSGFEHVEMQFLSDVYIRCPECKGRRYKAEVLDVKISPSERKNRQNRSGQRGEQSRGKSIADVLEMTVDEACDFFAGFPGVLKKLEPLRQVGLNYLRLGQPLPTLSGGEAQRLKLAGFLAKAHIDGTRPAAGKRAKRNKDGENGRSEENSADPSGPALPRGASTLFLFDEPTTGLHFHDIAVLIRAFRSLIDAGHSLVVIEHNLDVLRASDWIIELGPEGGSSGGKLVFFGKPEEILKVRESHTGRALKEYLENFASPLFTNKNSPEISAAAEGFVPYSRGLISIQGAREHNLKDLDVFIPRDALTVITGVSGSGKSTLAFDILFSEGQRRYLESLNAYARQFVQPASRPEVDSVAGVPPTVAIEQRTSRGGWKSTVATATEVYHYLRLLFVRLGTQYCPSCNVPILPQSSGEILNSLLHRHRGESVEIDAPLVSARKGYYTDLAAWAASKGYSRLRVDGELLETDAWPRLDRYREHTILLPVATVEVQPENEELLKEMIEKALHLGNDTIYLLAGNETEAEVFSTRRACPSCGRSFEELDPRLFSYNSRHGWCPVCTGTGNHIDESTGRVSVCPACGGARLRPEALAVRFEGRSIDYFNRMTIEEALDFFQGYTPTGRAAEISRDIVSELIARFRFLQQVGLGYLTLDRAAPTLSGGEAQRIRLAAQLGSNLRGVCYILDEPTIGLHPRDTRRLMETLKQLRGNGNSVVVVEHDEDTIRQADHIIDLGPGGGVRGGTLMFSGSLQDLLRDGNSATAQWLRNPAGHLSAEARGAKKEARRIVVKKARVHNLKEIDLSIPLERLVVITGVSGSGKSSLARDVIFHSLRGMFREKRLTGPPLGDSVCCESIEGWEKLSGVVEVDQSPIGKTPRSCPATYIGFWDRIRKLFAGTPEARVRGYTAARFSFNLAGGRCEACGGQGMKKIEMSFLPDVSVPCEVCGGKRFNRETLEVTYRGKNISQVLDMNVEEAEVFFQSLPAIHRPLQLLKEIGLGYLTLGQQSPSLSGGEAQRIKLVSELAGTSPEGRRGGGTLYILDEPTIGLHMADVSKLTGLLHRLVSAGNSSIVIEHNLDLIAAADWIIDLGPEGGEKGGWIVAQGSPTEIAARPEQSHTAAVLKAFLENRNKTG